MRRNASRQTLFAGVVDLLVSVGAVYSEDAGFPYVFFYLQIVVYPSPEVNLSKELTFLEGGSHRYAVVSVRRDDAEPACDCQGVVGIEDEEFGERYLHGGG
jgi:hypothetical protein